MLLSIIDCWVAGNWEESLVQYGGLTNWELTRMFHHLLGVVWAIELWLVLSSYSNFLRSHLDTIQVFFPSPSFFLLKYIIRIGEHCQVYTIIFTSNLHIPSKYALCWFTPCQNSLISFSLKYVISPLHLYSSLSSIFTSKI